MILFVRLDFWPEYWCSAGVCVMAQVCAVSNLINSNAGKVTQYSILNRNVL
jgi:hypothetical protein